MAEEFEESEVIFQESFNEDEDSNEVCDKFSKGLRNKKAMKREKMMINSNTKQKSASSSAPVNIPEISAWQLRRFNMDHHDLEGGDGEMVPPHVIIERRVAGKMMSLSVCSGYGRTLKGRDMCQVRNSILRMTGFLEA